MQPSKASSLRSRVRLEMIDEIKASARKHLATDGANLSLRAVARDLGMASSAVYRYFASRDDLLTALIIDAYDALGENVEQAEAAVRRGSLRARLLATCGAARDWARAHPEEYALTYGSPVPGYAAPQDTIGPASRPVLVLTSLLREGAATGELETRPDTHIPRTLGADLRALAEIPGYEGVPEAVFARGLAAWAHLFGVISFELFGRLTNAVHDYDAFFDHQMAMMADFVGFAR